MSSFYNVTDLPVQGQPETTWSRCSCLVHILQTQLVCWGLSVYSESPFLTLLETRQLPKRLFSRFTERSCQQSKSRTASGRCSSESKPRPMQFATVQVRSPACCCRARFCHHFVGRFPVSVQCFAERCSTVQGSCCGKLAWPTGMAGDPEKVIVGACGNIGRRAVDLKSLPGCRGSCPRQLEKEFRARINMLS